MARILPERPAGAASAAILRIHRLVEALPERFVAWSPMIREGSDLPDFWIVEETTLRGLVVLVSEATEEHASGPGLFASESSWTDPVKEAESRVEKARLALGIRTLRGAVVFPEVPSVILPKRVDGWPGAGKEICRPNAFPGWVDSHLGDPLEPEVLQKIRAVFSPESVLHSRHVMRRESQEPEVPKFLTWKQEEILKSDLDAGDEGRRSAGDFGLLLVQGVAGSGKSLVMLHRALLLSRLRRANRILVLTCNKPLQVELQRRFAELSQGEGDAEFSTFHAFCLKRWPDGNRPKIMEPPQRRSLHEDALASLKRPLLLRKHIEEEFSWIFDHGFATEAEYAEHPRRGRGFRMDAETRTRMWNASVVFRETCLTGNVVDWSLLPLQFRDRLGEGGHETYDAILVDEAQFFAPVWFDSIRQYLSPRAHLFLCADPSQGFLRRGTSWKSVGLSVHGRSRRLERSHRSTLPIMDLAWRIWNARAPESNTETVVPRLDGMADGPVPVWFRFPDARSEQAWVVDQVVAFVEGGGSPSDVLVLHDDWSAARDLLERLQDGLGIESAADARTIALEGPVVRVCTLNAATGLESPVVFLVGAQRIFEREGSPDLDAEERPQVRDEATRKFHMALTRAGWRLVVTSVGSLPTEIVECLRAGG